MRQREGARRANAGPGDKGSASRGGFQASAEQPESSDSTRMMQKAVMKSAHPEMKHNCSNRTIDMF